MGLHEGSNIDLFRRELSGISYLTIPKVYWDLTTHRVLTMSFVEGEIITSYWRKL